MIAVVGYGSHGQGVAQALVQRATDVVAIDDNPSVGAQAHAEELGIELHGSPDQSVLRNLLSNAVAFVPTPGLPENHDAFTLAAETATPTLTEFDLAQQWDDRPVYAVTGTDGKTTVTAMIAEILNGAGKHTIVAGNTEPPFVTAIDDPTFDCFVVEASSFRLANCTQFAPQVGAWLNFGPDHLDVHTSLQTYEAAKARIWQHHGEDRVAIGAADDPVVRSHLPAAGRVETFGLINGDHHVADGKLVVAGSPLMATTELWRHLPHDQTNALVAAAVAAHAGVDAPAIAEGLRLFRGLPHRIELIADVDNVRWYNDSKATTPHAVLAGVGGFQSAVLIAGGRNKGLSLDVLASLAPRLRAVVATGDAQDEIAAVFDHLVPVIRAESMDQAVTAAAACAKAGDVVVLSPGCTSYDWYSNYAARGDDFTQTVHHRITRVAPADSAHTSASNPNASQIEGAR